MAEDKRTDHPLDSEAGNIFLARRISTGDPRRPWADAMAVANGRVAAIGSREAICAAYASWRVVDLEGALVLPGLIDPHNHVLEGARSALYELQLAGDLDFGGIVEAVGRKAKRAGRTEWIVGGPFAIGRCPQMFSEAGRAALDEASEGRPVLLRDLSLHARFANTQALARAGVDDATTDPRIGRFVRDGRGRLTGLAFEYAANPLEAAVPPLTDEEWVSCARHGLKLLNAAGVTGFGLAIASARTMKALKTLDEQGALSARVACYLNMVPLLMAFERDGIGEELVSRRHEFRTARINTDCAKFFMDGVPLQHTAAFIDPYLDGPQGERGECAFTVEDLADRIGRLDAQGLSVKVHAIGDRAVRDTLDAIERVRERSGHANIRHTIAHLQFIAPDDVARLSKLNVGADLCPPMWFPFPNDSAFRACLGDGRVDGSWPIRDIVASRALAAVGSDWPAISPVPNPWPGISALITRRNPFQPIAGRLGAAQAIEAKLAVALSSANGAEMIGFGAVAGRLREGFSADFIAIDRDVFSCDPEAIADTKVLQTWFEGRCVHDIRAQA